MNGHDIQGCLACDLTNGRRELPGGRIHATEHWVVEHCVGPLGLGTLIVKPERHCLHVWDMTESEAAELGPLLRRVTMAIGELVDADQVYVGLWSHMNWTPGHIHFVVQPAWNRLREQHERPGPFLQAEMFEANELPPPDEVTAFAEKARSALGALPS
ncbi:MAG: hypothetical protein WD939_02880 [Dehalococcoidia bacterium]